MSDREICTYEVASLDTLNSIALKFNMKISELLSLNNLSNCCHVHVGQILRVYGKSSQSDSFDHSKQTEQVPVESNDNKIVELSHLCSDHKNSHPLSLQRPINSFSSFGNPNESSETINYMEILRTARSNYIFTQLSLGNYAKKLFSSTALRESLNIDSVFIINDRCTNVGSSYQSCGANLEKVECTQKKFIPGKLRLLPVSIKFEPCIYNLDSISLNSAVSQLEYSDIVDIQVLDNAEQTAFILDIDNDSSNLCNQNKISGPFPLENQRSDDILLYLDTSKENTKMYAYISSNIRYVIQKLQDHSLEILRFVVTRGFLSCTEGQKQGQISNTFHFLVSKYMRDTILESYRRFYQLRRQHSKSPILIQPSSETKESFSDQHTLFIPALSQPSAILTTEKLKLLAKALPLRFQFLNWRLLYSSQVHGVSIHTLYNRARNQGPSYLIIEDECKFQFGAYISDSWTIREHYYGTGECFLFSIYPFFNVYPWSELNEFFIYTKKDVIAIGGGSGQFGIFIEPYLIRGRTSFCETFKNPVLSHSENFKCVILEIWGFQTDSGISNTNYTNHNLT